jgi:hypothetical protein
VNQWSSAYRPGLHGYLLPDGSLIRAAAQEGNQYIDTTGGGLIERFDWAGNKVWDYDYNHSSNFDTAVLQHHDIEIKPNGNILMVAWETLSVADNQGRLADSFGGVAGPLGIPEIAVFTFDDICLTGTTNITVNWDSCAGTVVA